MKRRIVIGTVFSLTICVIIYTVYARSIAPPPKVGEITDTWVGYTGDDLDIYRLMLSKDGTGLCAVSYIRNPAVLYDVTAWKLDGYKLDVTLKPIDPKAEPIKISGKTSGWHLNLKVEGKGWDRILKMYRESELQVAYKSVQGRMLKQELEKKDE